MTIKTNNSKLLAVDVFSGCGGMSLGFEAAGFHVVAGFDNNPHCVTAYRKNFPDSKAIAADLGTLSGKELRSAAKIGNRHIDLLFGGPPCGGFSIAGQRDPDDPRNRLLVRFAELVAELRPSFFVVENVRGLVIGEAEKTLTRFRRVAERAGYEIVWPVRILNAADFGVPQRRERVLILGAKKSLELPVYPAVSTPVGAKSRITVRDAIGDLAVIDEQQASIVGDTYTGRLGSSSEYAKRLRRDRSDEKITKTAALLTGCSRVIHTKKTLQRFKKTVPGKREPISRCYRLAYEGLAPTLRAGTDLAHGKFTAVRPIHPEHDRCITVRESARLHSFPDWFQFHPTRWHGSMQIGNAVPPLLAEAVATAVRTALMTQ